MRFATHKTGLGAAMAALLTFAAAGSHGQTPNDSIDVFTAYAVPVDAEAESTAKAREAALAEGQREGLLSVLRRLTLAEDWQRLPPVTSDGAAALVESIQVEDEKSSAVRYLASLTIEFRDDGVRQMLRAAGLPFTESRAQATLVLPVYERDGRSLLFDEDNPWLAAWSAYRAPPGRLFPLVVPIGDLEDIANLDAATALAGEQAALSRVSARYGATNVLVVQAVSAGGRLALNLRWFGPTRRETEDSAVPATGEATDEAALLARAVEDTAAALEERWKRDTLRSAGGAEQRLDARLPIESLQDWIAARQRLGRNGMINRVEVASMTRDSVQLAIHFQGEPEQLALSLAQNDLVLVDEGGGWLLTLRRDAGSGRRE